MNKSNILKKSYEIETLLKNRESVGSKYFVIYYKKKENKDVRIVISASKKLGDAVVRNYQKRVIREIIRKNLKKFEGLDLLFVIKANSLVLDYNEKENQIKYLIKKMNIKGEKKNEK